MYVFKSPHKEHNRSVVTMRSNSILIMFIVAAVQEACEVNASSMFIPWLGDLVVEAQESTQAQATASGTASHSNSGTSDETQVSMTKGSSRISDSAAGEWSMVSPWLMEFQLSSVSRKPLPYVPRRCKQNESTWLVHSFKRQGHWYNSIDWVANWLIQHSKSQCKVWHSTRRWSMLFRSPMCGGVFEAQRMVVMIERRGKHHLVPSHFRQFWEQQSHSLTWIYTPKLWWNKQRLAKQRITTYRSHFQHDQFILVSLGLWSVY